jgi:endonuclease YncB( thermonuclease family)
VIAAAAGARAAEPAVPPRTLVPAALVRVVDGDTLRVRPEPAVEGWRAEENVRIIGIDAPERGEDGAAEMGAPEAGDAAARWLAGRRLRLVIEPRPGEGLRDAYGRILAFVEDDAGADLGLDLLRQGLVRVYRRGTHARKQAYEKAEGEARAAGRGVWAEGPSGEWSRLVARGSEPIRVYATGGRMWAVCLARRLRLEVPGSKLVPLLSEMRKLSLDLDDEALRQALGERGFVPVGSCDP